MRLFIVLGILFLPLSLACHRAASDGMIDSAQQGSAADDEESNTKGTSQQSTRSVGNSNGDTESTVDNSSSSNQPATPKTSTSNETVDITFEEIDLPMDADMVFRPFMLTDRVKELDGKRIRISGYMLADAQLRGIKQFILLKNTECKFGPGGQADHLINVKMTTENGVTYQTEPVSVEGILRINPFTGIDGNTWSIYDLECDRVSKYKPKR